MAIPGLGYGGLGPDLRAGEICSRCGNHGFRAITGSGGFWPDLRGNDILRSANHLMLIFVANYLTADFRSKSSVAAESLSEEPFRAGLRRIGAPVGGKRFLAY